MPWQMIIAQNQFYSLENFISEAENFTYRYIQVRGTSVCHHYFVAELGSQIFVQFLSAALAVNNALSACSIESSTGE